MVPFNITTNCIFQERLKVTYYYIAMFNLLKKVIFPLEYRFAGQCNFQTEH